MHVALLTVLVSHGSAAIPLRLALQNESVSLPSATRLFTNFNPGFELGTEWRYRERPRLTIFQAFTLGGFHHEGLMTAPYVSTAFGVRPVLVRGLFVEAALSVGYLANFSALALFSREW